MRYMIVGAIVLSTALLAACTHIYISPTNEEDDPFGVSVQTSNSTNIMGSQNVQKDDKAGRGDVSGHKGNTDQKSTATPTVVVPITSPIGSPQK